MVLTWVGSEYDLQLSHLLACHPFAVLSASLELFLFDANQFGRIHVLPINRNRYMGWSADGYPQIRILILRMFK